MRKIFLDDLPKRLNGNTLWYKCIGKEIKFIYEEVEGKFLVLDYYKNGTNYTIKLKYKDNIIETYPSNLLNCNICKIIKYEKKHNYLYHIGDQFIDNKRHITITGYERKEITRLDKKKEFKYGYTFICGICGWKNGWISETELKNDGGCSCCHSKVVVKGINDIPTTDPWMVPYFQCGYDEAKLYNCCSTKRILFKCPDCNYIMKQKTTIANLYTHKGVKCPICSDGYSSIAKYFYDLLLQLKEQKQIDDFEMEKKFTWCSFFNPFIDNVSYGIYDFVIKNKKLIIEIDGGFHRKPRKESKMSLDEIKYRDNQKDILATNNGYDILRISDEGGFQNNIISSILINIFDLSNIDWNRCLQNS